MCKISYFFHFAPLCAYWWDALKCVNFSLFFFLVFYKAGYGFNVKWNSFYFLFFTILRLFPIPNICNSARSSLSKFKKLQAHALQINQRLIWHSKIYFYLFFNYGGRLRLVRMRLRNYIEVWNVGGIGIWGSISFLFILWVSLGGFMCIWRSKW